MININCIEKKILFFLFYYSLVIQGLMSLLKLPQMFLYIKDFLLLISTCLFICTIFNRRRIEAISGRVILVLILFLLVSLLSGFVRGVDSFKILIALRKVFRGFIYMILCSEFLRFKDIDGIIQRTYKVQMINFVIIVIQRIILNIGQDHCNGIFGTGMTNNYNSVLCLILICYSTAEYINNKMKFKKWVFQVIINLGIAVVAELKVLFFMIPVCVLIIMRKRLLTSKGVKMVFLLSLGVLFAILGFGIMYNEQLSVFTSITGLLNYNRWGLESHSIVTRLNWVKYTLDNIFCGDIFSTLFGVGFGEVSGILSLNFENNVYRVLGYGAYCASTIFLETGLIGIILIFLTLIFVLMDASITKGDYPIKITVDFTQAFVFSMLIFLVYSNYIYNDSAFLVFFVLALPYISKRELRKKEN